jgi:Mn2+/Fe2+ NRAMP family transporter
VRATFDSVQPPATSAADELRAALDPLLESAASDVTELRIAARFGLSLVWVTVLGVVGICLFAEMSGRVAAVTRRGTFDLIRERLGPRAGLLNLVTSLLVTVLTFTAEIGGVAR